jgi:hypothetical protein
VGGLVDEGAQLGVGGARGVDDDRAGPWCHTSRRPVPPRGGSPRCSPARCGTSRRGARAGERGCRRSATRMARPAAWGRRRAAGRPGRGRRRSQTPEAARVPHWGMNAWMAEPPTNVAMTSSTQLALRRLFVAFGRGLTRMPRRRRRGPGRGGRSRSRSPGR